MLQYSTVQYYSTVLMLQYSALAPRAITGSPRDHRIEDKSFLTDEVFTLLPEVISEFLFILNCSPSAFHR